MSTATKIEFTHHTASPWWGCSKVHEGCKNCYAEKHDARFKGGNWGNQGTRKRIASFDGNCRKWDRQAAKEGVRRRVFVSMCDPFEHGNFNIVDHHGRVLGGTIHSHRLAMFETIDACLLAFSFASPLGFLR